MTQGRHGELIVVQGNGVRPARWSGTGAAVDAGMDAPQSAPGVTVDGGVKYYVARVDVTKPGACYYAPPVVAFDTGDETPEPGTIYRVIDGYVPPTAPPASKRTATAASYLNQSTVGEIRVLDSGKGYSTQPTVTLSDTHGKGAEIEAILDGFESGPPADPTDDPTTGITDWEIISSGGAGSQFAGRDEYSVDLPVSGNGRFEVTLPFYVKNAASSGYTCGFAGVSGIFGYTNKLAYTVSGVTSGSGAVVRLKWSGGTPAGTCTGSLGQTASFWQGADTASSAKRFRYGAGYSDTSVVRITITPLMGDSSQTVVLEGMTRGNANNNASPRYPVKSLSLKSGGSGYLVAPQIKITSDSGFGAYGTCKVKNGRITEVTLENSGGGYKTAPTVEVVSGGAEAFAVSRPHLRGKYQCYYRFVDDTPEDKGGPIPSNLSPLTEIDAGEGSSGCTWTFAAAAGRAKKVELWRSTSNQATTLYRVATIEGSAYPDTLTDDELRDPDRDGYAAMPIVLPNGELNANRFGVPPSDKAVVVRFQDRFWYGVDTGGKGPNTIYYSEVDEPESVPDANEIILQQNARDGDSLRAMIPFGSTLLLMQQRHAYSLTFAKNPILDAQVTPIAFRGCLTQRCWDIHDGVCYVADQQGVYAITPTGQIESISDAIANVFREEIDFAKRTWAFLLVDPKAKVLRFFAAFKKDSSGGLPSRTLCYSIDAKAWWYEKHPQAITGGSQAKLSNGDFRCVYGGQSGPLLLGEGAYDISRGAVRSATLTNAGAGYRTPPKVTAAGGCGAEFQASINGSGNVTAIWIVSPGYGYTSGNLTISPPDDPTVASPVTATATFVATSLTQDTALFPTYRFKGGNAEYVTDATDPKAAGVQPRNIRLSYQPQLQPCPVSLRTYYNGSQHPRGNVAVRNRGTGFTNDGVDNAARLDMAAQKTATGYDTGTAVAMFSGRSLDDIRSSDRHVSVEVVGPRTGEEPVTFYQIEVDGTAGK
jgi:hypothetical protein